MYKKLTSLILSSVMVFSIFSATVSAGSGEADAFRGGEARAVSFEEADASQIEGFVTRLYRVCLDRSPDQAGLADWTGKLAGKKITGMECAYGFVFSAEFQGRNLGDSDYVEKMYQAFLGRASDATGKADWVGRLQGGMSRFDLFLGFANSTEFTGICESYGIERGDYSGGRFVNQALIRAFVTRLYEVCLRRSPDPTGLADWTNKLAFGSITGTEAAAGFFFSKEYRSLKRSNDEFVEDLYNCFLGRASDTEGKASWAKKLIYGASDLSVFNGFSQSQEYDSICASYGIKRGGAYNGGYSCRERKEFDIKQGSCGRLEGKILVVSIFADEASTKWDPNNNEDVKLMYRTKDCIGIAADYLTREAKRYGKNVSFIYDWKANDGLFFYAHFDFDAKAVTPTELSQGQFNFLDSRYDWIGLMNQYGADGIIFCFLYNSDYSYKDRSFALPHYYANQRNPYESINMYLKHRSYDADPDDYAHEMLHLFGVPDLYVDSDLIPQAYVDEMIRTKSYDVMYKNLISETIQVQFSDLDAYYAGIAPRPAVADQWGLGKSYYE